MAAAAVKAQLAAVFRLNTCPFFCFEETFHIGLFLCEDGEIIVEIW